MSVRFLRKSLLSLFLVSALTGLGWTGETNPPRAFVIVVGVSTYDDKKIEPRRHAEADATALYDLLSRKEFLGADAKNVQLLLGRRDEKRPSELATRANIVKALTTAVKEAKADDLVLFAFFGRGGGEGKRVGLFGVDANVTKPADAAITADDLADTMKGLASQRVCAILDVALGGFENSSKALQEVDSQDLVRMFLGDERIWGYLPPAGRAVFVPNNPTKASLEMKDHGAFATALLAALKGAADSEGYEPDGHILVSELDKHLKATVPMLAREHGKTKDEKEYALAYIPGRFSHFSIARNPAVAEPALKQRMQFLSLAKDLPDEVVQEGTRLLDRMPRAKAQQELRKSYQKLAANQISAKDLLKERDEITRKLALPRADAMVFSKSVLQAMNLIRQQFHEDLKVGLLLDWAVRGLYQEIDEPLPKGLADRLAQAERLTEADVRDVLTEARSHLGKRDDLMDRKDLDITLRHMTQHIRDKFTKYYDTAEAKRLTDSSSGRFAGIGVQIRKDTSVNAIRVLTAFKDGPAYKAGLRGGDLLVDVTPLVDKDGRRLPKVETISTKELEIPDVVKIVTGRPNTPVKLGVLKAGAKDAVEIEVERDWVMLEAVVGHQRKADDSWDYWVDPKTKIGYVRLLEFSGPSPQEIKKVMSDLKDNGMKGCVLDLRFNPGGLLRSAIQISDLLVETGDIVTIKSRNGADKKSVATGVGKDFKFPMVCLVNEHSASGSEILAACLQDHKRARIIGERSYGKGTVAGVFDYAPTKAIFTVSNASFWRPNGKNLNRFTTKGGDDEDWGVKPDEGFHVKLTNQERTDLYQHLRDREYILRPTAKTDPMPMDFRDRQLERAVEYLREQVK